MKIKELLSKVNKSDKFKDHVDITQIGNDMNIYIQDYIEQERLTSYFIGSWYCTDSYVGWKVYFLDDKPVAVTSQMGRKCDETFEWFSKEDFENVKKYILTFKEVEESNFILCNLDEEIGETYKINFNSQLFEYHKEIALYNGVNVKIIKIDKDSGENHYIAKSVKIQYDDKTEISLNVDELDFPYNLL